MIKVQDHPDWMRNDDGTLVNVNQKAYQAYLAKRALAESQHAQIQTLKSEINILNNKMDMILNLLQGNK